MKPVSRAVDRLLRGLGIAADVDRAGAIEHWGAAASEVFGSDATVTRAVAVDGQTLVVTVPTSAWASEIRLRESALLAALRRASPKSDIRRVRAVPSTR